jgi:3-oxoacyl-ACP reductase-like protein
MTTPNANTTAIEQKYPSSAPNTVSSSNAQPTTFTNATAAPSAAGVDLKDLQYHLQALSSQLIAASKLFSSPQLPAMLAG